MPDTNYNFIAQGAQQPNALSMIGNVANTANAMQNYQRGNIALQQEQALLQPSIEQGVAQAATAQTQADTVAYNLKNNRQRTY